MKWSLRTNDFKRDYLNGEAILCNKKDTFLLGFKKLALHWSIALFSVFIPVLHFILVPVFLFVGVYSFFKQYKLTHYIADASYTCPDCLNNLNIKNIYFSIGQKINCELCQVQLVIEAET